MAAAQLRAAWGHAEARRRDGFNAEELLRRKQYLRLRSEYLAVPLGHNGRKPVAFQS